jgi:hypothetical protein
VISRSELLSILTPLRLDIAIKYRMFVDDDAAAITIYRAHIMQRTGGVEPGGLKRCVDDYVAAAWALQLSMATTGFDIARPIRFCTFGKLRGGAHRIACALALGLPIWRRIVRGRSTQRPWDAEQLARAGISTDDIERARRDMEVMRHAACNGDQ